MRFLVHLGILFYCAAATAGLYSWKDAQGKIHYSDQPPSEKTPVRKVTPPPAPAMPPAPAAKNAAEPEAGKKPAAPGEAAKADPADAEKRRANCEQARGNLKALESGNVRFGVSPQGERIALDAERLQAEINNARQAVEGWCK